MAVPIFTSLRIKLEERVAKARVLMRVGTAICLQCTRYLQQLVTKMQGCGRRPEKLGLKLPIEKKKRSAA